MAKIMGLPAAILSETPVSSGCSRREGTYTLAFMSVTMLIVIILVTFTGFVTGVMVVMMVAGVVRGVIMRRRRRRRVIVVTHMARVGVSVPTVIGVSVPMRV